MDTFLRKCHSPTKIDFVQRLVLFDNWARELRVPALKSDPGALFLYYLGSNVTSLLKHDFFGRSSLFRAVSK